MPAPVVEFSGAGGDSFGTSVSRSRLSAAGLGTPLAAKPSSGFNASGLAASDFAAVSAGTQLPPLTKRGKFALAMHDCLDYSGFTWTAILAGQSLAMRADPELGTGIKGYGRYYWRAFADGVSGTFFTEAIVPSIAHEDPRYYTMEQGGFFRRTGYAISRAVLTKTDSGRTRFSFSEVVGNALEAGLSNAYYPPQERGLSQTATNWGTQMESAVLNHLFQEFWPDIRRSVFRRK